MVLRTVGADLHNHLRTFSFAREGEFDRFVDRARLSLGVGGVAGMINFSDQRYEKLMDLKGYDRKDLGTATFIPSHDLLIYRGQEVATQQGHVLIVGLPRKVDLKDGLSLEHTLDEADEHGAIKIVDHPFFHSGLGPFLKQNPRLLARFNAIEVESGESYLWIPGVTRIAANNKAEEWHREVAENLHIAGVHFSDGHSIGEIGLVQTRIKMPDSYHLMDGSAALEALKTGIRFAHSTPPGADFLTRMICRAYGAKHAVEVAIGYSIRKKLDLET